MRTNSAELKSVLRQPPWGEDQAWQELKALLEERITAGLAGEVSGKNIGDIIEEELARDNRA